MTKLGRGERIDDRRAHLLARVQHQVAPSQGQRVTQGDSLIAVTSEATVSLSADSQTREAARC